MPDPRDAGGRRTSYVKVPEWLRSEEPRYVRAILSAMLDWDLFGPPDTSIREYFSDIGDGWTDRDTEHVYRLLVDNGVISDDSEQRTQRG